MDQVKSTEDANNSNGTENNKPHLSTIGGKEKEAISNCTKDNGNNKKKIDWPARVQAVCTVALVVITGFYTYYASKQVCEMKRSSDASIIAAKAAAKSADIAAASANSSEITINKTLAEMKTQSEAMQKSAEASKKTAETSSRSVAVSERGIKAIETQSRLDQRAWIGIETVLYVMEPGKPLAVKVVLKNSGKSPAINLRHIIIVETTLKNAKPDYSKEVIYSSYSGACIAPQAGFVIHSSEIPPNDGLINNIIKGDIILFAHGIVYYDDTFQRHHWISYCHYFSPKINAFESYYEHNSTDDNQKGLHNSN